jgi:predicted peptidase
LTDLPIWAFHGTSDEAVPFQESVTMVDAIKAAGGTKVRFTTLEHFGHNTWSAAYASPELFQWMEREAANRSSSMP